MERDLPSVNILGAWALLSLIPILKIARPAKLFLSYSVYL